MRACTHSWIHACVVSPSPYACLETGRASPLTDITRPRMVPTAKYPARVDAWLLLLVNQLFIKLCLGSLSAVPGKFLVTELHSQLGCCFFIYENQLTNPDNNPMGYIPLINEEATAMLQEAGALEPVQWPPGSPTSVT